MIYFIQLNFNKMNFNGIDLNKTGINRHLLYKADFYVYRKREGKGNITGIL